ncbi:MAG: restriction endonuclease [Anaerolinea sp.]|jgi:5-methylcytosine-specific restriction enzyme subunit McrC|nr:restriction endonuclease [Anaerolinea sp.]
MQPIVLTEWYVASPETMPELVGLELGNDKARQLAEALTRNGRLAVLELRRGLRIETTSFVGSLRIGPIQLSIQPKLQGMPLLNLLRYAYGLRHLELFSPQKQGVQPDAFQDLLCHQLAAEAEELISRGLHRRYERRHELLASPRGRIDFTQLAGRAGTAQSSLPCIHHPRLQDTLINQVLLAGLQSAARLTHDLPLRTHLRRLAALLDDQVTPVRLVAETMQQVRHQGDRLVATYQPALAIVELLMEAQGTVLEAGERGVPVPGFLFDMNRFFQALISRFLHDFLPAYTVRDEYRLRDMLAFVPERNPQSRQSPTPRPDFLVQDGSRTVALLDTKYRDLWAETLPRDMLYQLVIYALSQDPVGQAIILYPTLNSAATEAWIEVRDPLLSSRRALVVLRPVDMSKLACLVSAPRTATHDRATREYAYQLAVGGEFSVRAKA